MDQSFVWAWNDVRIMSGSQGKNVIQRDSKDAWPFPFYTTQVARWLTRPLLLSKRTPSRCSHSYHSSMCTKKSLAFMRRRRRRLQQRRAISSKVFQKRRGWGDVVIWLRFQNVTGMEKWNIYPTVVTSGIRQRTFVSSLVSYFVCSFFLRACKELKLFLIRKNC